VRGRPFLCGATELGEAVSLDPVSPVRLRWLAVQDREQQPTFVAPMLLTPGPVPDGEGMGARAEVGWLPSAPALRPGGIAAHA
jgi:hypothetical protein